MLKNLIKSHLWFEALLMSSSTDIYYNFPPGRTPITRCLRKNYTYIATLLYIYHTKRNVVYIRKTPLTGLKTV